MRYSIVLVILFGLQDVLFANPSLHIGVIGDSYTRAMWADTSIGNLTPRAILDYARILMSPNGRNQFAPSDSPNGNNLQLVTNDEFKKMRYLARDDLSFLLSEQNSWGLPVKLQKEFPNAYVENFSELGGTFRNAYEQVEDLIVSGKKPDILIVNLNGLDFLLGEADLETEATMDDFLGILLRNQEWDVFFTLPMNASSLFNHGDPVTVPPLDLNPFLQRFEEKGIDFNFKPVKESIKLLASGVQCSDIFDLFGFYYNPKFSTKADLEELQNSIEYFRERIKQKADMYNLGFGNYQGKISFTQLTLPENVGPYLAVDCLHPNAKGQELLGEQFWPEFRAYLQGSGYLRK